MLIQWAVFIALNVFFECAIVIHWPWLRKQLTNQFFLSLGFSMGLSWVLTHVFPSDGQLIYIGGIGSSLVMLWVYSNWDDLVAKWEGYKRLRAKVKTIKADFKQKISPVMDRFKLKAEEVVTPSPLH